MPGSPPSRMIDPRTSPPPSTRSSSEMPVRQRTSSSAWIWLMGETAAALPPLRAGEEERGADCSRVFHSPQPGHFPNHLTVS